MKTFRLILIIIIPVFCHGQKQANIWYFGNHAGIDFNSCTPIVLTNGRNPGGEGCSTICDTSGQLLFYTNSDTVWNKQHIAMPNGNLVASSGTISQVLIIPQPSSQNIFFIITLQIQGEAPLTLQYHTIDMSLNSGLGGVTNKNNTITTTTITEQVAATYHQNGVDIWFVVHEYNSSNSFLSYLITSSGISSTPVVSSVGPAIIPCSSGMNARGQLQFSPNGQKLAINNNGIGNNPNSDYLCLFDFDNSTGIVSNPINLPYERGGYGLSFSPDNTKLYAATWKAFNFTSTDSNKVYQFDISSNDSLIISNTKTILYTTPLTAAHPFGTLTIGPDGKVYVANNSNYLGVINSPNTGGTGCNFNTNGFYLGGKTAGEGLNNYILYQNYCTVMGIEQVKESSNQLLVYPNPFAEGVTIKYFIPENTTNAQIVFYDEFGNQLNTFAVSTTGAGQLNIASSNLAPGTYSYSLIINGKVVDTKKMIKTN
jgi:type IX secretion system substrate protein